MNPSDIDIIRSLAGQVAEIAALPVQEQTRQLWRDLNALRPQRPMVMIDQVCWNEMNGDDELTLRCEDPHCRQYEQQLRQLLFQWHHFRVDMVVEPFIRVPKAIHSTGYGIGIKEERAVTDPTNSVVGHRFFNQLERDEDLDKLKTPQVSHDPAETARRLELAATLFGGLLEVRPWGHDPYLSLWDPISHWMGVEGALYGLIDRPEFMHELLRRFTAAMMSFLDQLEGQGLFSGPQSLIHCTGAWTDELPAEGYDPDRPRAKDMWMFGLAQMLSTVSPEMFDEFEVRYASPVCARFGLVYYGCCDPLDGTMPPVRQIPNVRKISMSPWVEQARGAAEVGGDYVFSRKPSPALLAWDRFNANAVADDLRTTRDICREHGCPLELILKDISTVRYEPQRLFQWADTAMAVVQGG